jgi:hypothetical protein
MRATTLAVVLPAAGAPEQLVCEQLPVPSPALEIRVDDPR